MKFHISGIMAIIQLWLEQDCREPVDFISSLIRRCIKTVNTADYAERK